MERLNAAIDKKSVDCGRLFHTVPHCSSCRRRWPTWSACFAVSKYQPLGHTAHQTVYCWQPCLSGCCSSSLERSARGRHLIVIIAVFQASTKDSSFSTIIPTPDGRCSDCLSGIVIVVLVVTLLFRPLYKFVFTYLLTYTFVIRLQCDIITQFIWMASGGGYWTIFQELAKQGS